MKRSLLVCGVSLAFFAAASTASAQTISNVMPSVIPTTGASIEVTGTGFGVAPGVVRVGAGLCTVTFWSDTRITCNAPPGAGTGVPVIVQVGAMPSTVFNVAYGAPSIVNATPQDGATQGGATIMLMGSNFFTVGTLRFNGAPVTTGSWTHGLITFPLPAGQGATNAIELTVGGQSTATNYRYGAPSITGINPMSGPPAGGNTVVIMGNNFGTTPIVTIGSSVCTLQMNSHTMIQCLVPPGSGTQPVVVTVAGQRSTSGTTYTYGSGAVDAGADAASDARADATPDAQPDAQPDAAPDVVIDSGITEPDANDTDASMDSATDSGALVSDASTARDGAASDASSDGGTGPTTPGGCGCATPTNTHTESNRLWILSSIAAAIGMLSRARRRR